VTSSGDGLPEGRRPHEGGSGAGGPEDDGGRRRRILRLRPFTWPWLSACLTVTLAAVSLAMRLDTPAQRLSWRAWSSTNLANLHDHPAAALIASAVVPDGDDMLWVCLLALGLGILERTVGRWRAGLTVLLAHLGGTAVSEGVVAWRIHAGALPTSSRHIIDTGPSYLVVAALVGVTACSAARRSFRVICGLIALALAPSLLAGLTSLDVAAVGHLCAAGTGAVLSRTSRVRNSRHKPPSPAPAP